MIATIGKSLLSGSLGRMVSPRFEESSPSRRLLFVDEIELSRGNQGRLVDMT